MIIIENDMNEYLASKAFGASDLKNIHISPSRYFTYKKSSPSQNMGTAFHLLMQDENEFKKSYFITPKFDCRTKEGKEIAKKIEDSGSLKMFDGDFDALRTMRDNVLSHPVFKEYYESSDVIKEVTIVEKDESGLMLKSRPDVYGIFSSVVLDYKTTKDATRNAFEYDIRKYGYDLTAAHYMSVCDVDSFFLVAVENVEPYGVALYKFGKQSISERVHKMIERAKKDALVIQSLNHDYNACRNHFSFQLYDGGQPFEVNND